MKKTNICHLNVINNEADKIRTDADKIKIRIDIIKIEANRLQEEIKKFLTYQNIMYAGLSEKFNFSDEEKEAITSLLFSEYEKTEMLPF